MIARHRNRWRMIVSLIFGFAGGVLLVVTDIATGTELDTDLLGRLRQGGYVFYFRHAATDWAQQDRARSLDDVSSCDPQRMRQLSSSGRDQARQVGEAIRGLGIPVSKVLASEYCRAVETAQLLGLGAVETTRDVINARVADWVGGQGALAQTARQRLSQPPPVGTNTVVVAHSNVFLMVAGTRPPEAGAAILQGEGAGQFRVIAQLSPEDWSRALAAEKGRNTRP